MIHYVEYLEKFAIKCKVCGSSNIGVSTDWNGTLVLECNKCEEIEEVFNDEKE